jgi:hypothetical protein
MAGMAGRGGIRYHRRTDIDVKPVICSGKILSGGFTDVMDVNG